MLFYFPIPMRPEEMQMLTALVSQTVLQVMATQSPPMTQAAQESIRERIDERHYRTMCASQSQEQRRGPA